MPITLTIDVLYPTNKF